MKALLKNIKKVITGERKLSPKKRMELVLMAIMVVRLISVVLFQAFHVWVMVLYNVIAIVFYVALFNWSRSGSLNGIRGLVFLELAVQITLSSRLIGFGGGFYVFGLGLLPLFYFIAAGAEESHSVRYIIWAGTASALVGVFLTGVFLFVDRKPPIYELGVTANKILFLSNLWMMILIDVGLSHLFLLDQKTLYDNLESRNEKLDLEASVDPLTSLYNRRAMETLLNDAMELAKTKGNRFGIIMCDIDDFKKINDTFGHDCGDEALKSAAAIMRSAVREGDFVCRWGGEEFLILVNGDMETAAAAAERIRGRTEVWVTNTAKGEIRFTITIGVATYMPGFNMETHIEIADRRLYYGKRHGKNQVVTVDHEAEGEEPQ